MVDELKSFENTIRDKNEQLDDLEQDAAEFSKWLHKLELQKVGMEHELLRSHEHVLFRRRPLDTG